MENSNKETVITLSNGSTAKIIKGKGKHAQEALKVSNGNGEKYITALMAQLVTINDKPIVMEDLEEMDMKDYMAIQGAFADQNF